MSFLGALRNLSRIVTAGGDRRKILARACESLVNDRGYYEAWVAGIDSIDRIEVAVRHGTVPPSDESRAVLAAEELPMELRGVLSERGATVDFFELEGEDQILPVRKMTVRLESDFEPRGVLAALMPRDLSRQAEEEMFLLEAGDRLALALHNFQVEAGRDEIEKALEVCSQDLDDHLKKLKYVYAVCKLIGQQNLSPERMLQTVTDLVPLAWRHPEAVCARICVGDREYRTDNYRPGPHPFITEMAAGGERVGTMEVVSVPDTPEGEPSPFTPEEQGLIRSIANLLAGVVRVGHVSRPSREEGHPRTTEGTSQTMGVP